MRNAHFVEHRTFGNKTGPRIETRCMKLRMQLQHPHATPPRFIDQRVQQRRPDTVATHLRQHGHSPYMTVGQQPAATDRPTLDQRQRVHADSVVFIPFEVFRNPLLHDEYCTAYRLQP